MSWDEAFADRYEEAASMPRKVSELNPSYADSKAQLATILLFQGRKSEAFDAVQQEPDEG